VSGCLKKKINISNEDFIKMLIDVFSTDFEAVKKEMLDYLNDEFNKPEKERDFGLIHECYLTLSECFGYEYNNEYEKLAQKQLYKRKLINKLKKKQLAKLQCFNSI
jgi:hypothetical protein